MPFAVARDRERNEVLTVTATPSAIGTRLTERTEVKDGVSIQGGATPPVPSKGGSIPPR